MSLTIRKGPTEAPAIPATPPTWAAALSLAVILVLSSWTAISRLDGVTPSGDKRNYLAMAFNIHVHGTASAEDDHPGGPPSTDRMPLYPAVLAGGLWLLDDGTLTWPCLMDGGGVCGQLRERLQLVNVALLGLSVVIAYVAGAMLFGSAGVGLLAAGLIGFSERMQVMATAFYTENLAVPLLGLLSLLLALGARREHPGLFALAGLALGFLTLTRAVFMYLWIPLILALAVHAVVRRWRRPAPAVEGGPGHPARLLACLAALVIGYWLVIGPWMVRNHELTGHYIVSHRYGNQLAKRAAANSMNWRQYLATAIYWNPELDRIQWIYDLLDERYLPSAQLKELFDSHELSFEKQIKDVRGPEIEQELRQAGRYSATAVQEMLSREARDAIRANPAKHLLVTIPFLYKGSFVETGYAVDGSAFSLRIEGKTVVNAILFGSWFWFLCLAIRARKGVLLMFLAPSAYLYFINGLAVFSIPRYNWPMLTILALTLALAMRRLVGGGPATDRPADGQTAVV